MVEPELLDLKVSAENLVLSIQPKGISSAEEIDRVIANIRKRKVEALLVPLTPLFLQHRKRLVEVLNTSGLPAIYELRTPLNAVIGFSEVLKEGMFGELNEKQLEYVKDIYASGHHLLWLTNDIFDLSKVEAGRMERQLSEFDLQSALGHALTLIKERATRHGIRLKTDIND